MNARDSLTFSANVTDLGSVIFRGIIVNRN